MIKNIFLKQFQNNNVISYNQFSKLLISDGAAGDRFGHSVSISSDGESIVIGAYLDDDKGADSGSAYVFTRQTNGQYSEIQKLLASDGAAYDYFGVAVSISGDGGTIVIGANGVDDKGSSSGSAYTFTRQTNGQYAQTQKLTASDGAANDYFGNAVSISDNGENIVIGAYLDDDKGFDSGSAYTFTRQTNGQYTQTQKLTASDGAASDNFGNAVLISGDGRIIVIGSYLDDDKGNNSGSAYVFTKQENGQYTQTQKLLASDGAAGDNFGRTVSISGDVGTIVIGANYDDDKGADSGSAYIFARQENGQYVETQKLLASDGAASDRFGYSVSISGDGGTIVIGAYLDDAKTTDSGSVYVFSRQENGQYVETKKLLASDGAADDRFGFAVSISSDGESVVIGANNKNGGMGTAYIFK